MASMIVVHGIPNCDTVKKARAWLQARGVDHRFHDFKKDGVPADRLADWLVRLDWALLVNRKGTTWRHLDPAAQAAVIDAATAADLMRREPSVIKRPVVDWSDRTTVGFDPDTWQNLLAAR
jgi:Spx/MgsR family transcriptional regulator